MFLLVPAHPGFPGQIPQSRKTVVCCVCVCNVYTVDQELHISKCIRQQHPFNGPLSWTTRVSPFQIGKTNLDLLEQEIMSGGGISRAMICEPAPRPRQITMPVPHHSVFTGQMAFLPPNQQRQSTEGNT